MVAGAGLVHGLGLGNSGGYALGLRHGHDHDGLTIAIDNKVPGGTYAVPYMSLLAPSGPGSGPPPPKM